MITCPIAPTPREPPLPSSHILIYHCHYHYHYNSGGHHPRPASLVAAADLPSILQPHAHLFFLSGIGRGRPGSSSPLTNTAAACLSLLPASAASSSASPSPLAMATDPNMEPDDGPPPEHWSTDMSWLPRHIRGVRRRRRRRIMFTCRLLTYRLISTSVLLLLLLLQLWDSCAAVTCHVINGGDFHIFANPKFTQTFMSPEELNQKHKNLGLSMIFAWSRWVREEEEVVVMCVMCVGGGVRVERRGQAWSMRI